MTKHGYVRSDRTCPEFASWRAMRHRCNSPKNPSWHNYGGRGIRVCDAWNASYETFIRDMGPRPGSGYSLERINNDGHYEPGNVRWATTAEQAANRRGRMTSEQVARARELLSQGATAAAVASDVGSTVVAIRFLRAGTTWNPNAPKRRRANRSY